MRGLQIERDALKGLVMRGMAMDPRQPRLTAGQVAGERGVTETLALPALVDGWSPPQDEQGRWKFIAGVSPLGGSDLLVE